MENARVVRMFASILSMKFIHLLTYFVRAADGDVKHREPMVAPAAFYARLLDGYDCVCLCVCVCVCA